MRTVTLEQGKQRVEAPARPKDPNCAPRRGQSLVEMALMLPVITLMLIGVADLARAFIYYERLTNAVKEGALYGINFPSRVTATSVPDGAGGYESADPKNIVYRVKQESANNAGTPDGNLVINVTTDPTTSDVLCYEGRTTTLKSGGSFAGDCSAAAAGDTIRVRARYHFYPLTKQMAGILGGGSPFTMTKSVRMVIIQ
jgi:TadE-like protein